MISYELDKTLAIKWRASLIQQAKALQEQRRAVLSQVAALEKRYCIGGEEDKTGERKDAVA